MNRCTCRNSITSAQRGRRPRPDRTGDEMSDLKPFTLYQIGEIRLEDDEESGFTGVVLRGDHDAVRAVAHLFHEPVAIVPATPAPVRAEGEAITDDMLRRAYSVPLIEGRGPDVFDRERLRFALAAALKAEDSR